MKKINFTYAAIALIALSVTFSSCKDDKDDEPTPAAPISTSQKLSFHLHTNVGNVEAEYGVEYQQASGRKFNLADFRYYISNIVLIKNDGSEYSLTGKVLLVSPTVDEYDLQSVPVGSYQGFKFMLGLDSATNHTDPTTYAATNPLAIQTPGIHWSWNSGYIFMKVEGQCDTTLAATGTPDYDYFYHIGLDGFKRTIDFTTAAFNVASGSDKELVLNFNLLQALSNVDMRIENETHTMNNVPLATKIADNWQSAFTQ